MSKRAKILLKRLAAGSLITTGLLLAGCGGSSDGSSGTAQNGSATTAASQQVAISGAAVKGIVSSAIVQAHQLESNSSGQIVIGNSVGGKTRTDSNGQFTLKLGGNASGWIVVELTADSHTQMTCDVAPSCVDYQGKTVAFGNQFPVSSQFKLDAALNLNNGTKVYLTPLSQMAVSLAQTANGGLTASNLSQSYAQVENIFGLKPGTLQLAPPDLTKLDNGNYSTDAMQLAVVNAAFLAMVDANQWSSVAQVIDTATKQIALEGTIASDNSNGDAFNVSAVESQAAVLASALEATVTNTLTQQSLAIIQDRSVQAVQSALEVAATSSPTQSPVTSTTTTTSPTTTTTSSTTTSGTTSTAPTTTTATLDWQAPSTREDGSSLAMSELAGYVIYYGQDPNNLNQQVTINDAYTMTDTLQGLGSGTWYFAIKAVDAQGNQSPLSQEVSKTF